MVGVIPPVQGGSVSERGLWAHEGKRSLGCSEDGDDFTWCIEAGGGASF